MPLSRQELLDVHSDLRNLRYYEEPQWREIAILMKPEEREIGYRNIDFRRVADEIFDSTALLALDEFEGGFFNQATNPADRWMTLTLPDKDLAKWGPVRQYLWQFGEAILNSASPSRSGFYVNVPACFGDMGCFGLGTMYSEEVQGADRYTDLAIPLSESFIDTDGQGNLTRFHREYPLYGRQAKAQFGEAASHLQDRARYYIVHAVFKNPDYREGALGPQGMEWSSVYVSSDDDKFRMDKGYYEMPYHSIPWRLRSGRVWPIGPGHLTRPDVNMLNEMERSHIVAAQFAAEPALLLHDQSVLTAADIQPNATLYGSINEDGKPLVQAFSRNADVKLSLEQSQQRRVAIQNAFKFSLMQLLNRPQMTATEFLGQQQTQLQLLAPNLGRVHHFGLTPWVRRRARMLIRKGLAPMPPPEMHGQKVEVEFVSPLAKAMKAKTGQATMQWVSAIGQLQQLDPQGGAMDNVDTDGVAGILHDAFGPPPGAIRDPKAIAQIRSDRAQAMQQQTQISQAGDVANTAATAAHALQAATLSNGRMGGPQGSGRAN